MCNEGGNEYFPKFFYEFYQRDFRRVKIGGKSFGPYKLNKCFFFACCVILRKVAIIQFIFFYFDYYLSVASLFWTSL